MIKILIADDHPIVRQGLKQTLTGQPDMTVGGEARTSQEVLDLAHREDWDVLILDVTMPGQGGLEVLKTLRQEKPRMAVLILSIHPEDIFGIRALRLGASGYMTKESAPEQLVNAVRKIAAGGKHISPALAEKLALHLNNNGRAPHEALSDREYQVLRLIASGKSPAEIAERLSLSAKTVSTYRNRILRKMKLKNNVEIAQYAIQHRLIE
jgi:DNA-binding NarL/FixJ family response regulator